MPVLFGIEFASDTGSDAMPYFTRDQSRIDRGGKVLADIAAGVLLLTFSVVFFGPMGGALAFLILEAALIGVDYVVPSSDDGPGNAVR
jgi:hypothetical protein